MRRPAQAGGEASALNSSAGGCNDDYRILSHSMRRRSAVELGEGRAQQNCEMWRCWLFEL